jgi:putative transposase
MAGTTQRCSECGFMPEEKISLDVLEYRCKNCGLVIDRDHNAAINILNAGQELTHVEGRPYLLLLKTGMSK